MCANSEGSGDARAFAVRLCDKYHNLMNCLICCFETFYYALAQFFSFSSLSIFRGAAKAQWFAGSSCYPRIAGSIHFCFHNLSSFMHQASKQKHMKKKYMQTEDPLSLSGPRQANLVLIAYASSEGSGEPAHPRSLARTFAARSYKHWVKRNLQTESQIPSPSEWLGMRSYNLLWRNARRHKFAWPGSSKSDHFHTNNMMSSGCT